MRLRDVLAAGVVGFRARGQSCTVVDGRAYRDGFDLGTVGTVLAALVSLAPRGTVTATIRDLAGDVDVAVVG